MSARQLEGRAAERLKMELAELDRVTVEVDGIRLKPSQCYRFETDPMHIMYNTNCPDDLKEQIERIFLKYRDHEGGTQ